MNETQVSTPAGDGAAQMGLASTPAPPKTVKELIAAWQLSGRQAHHLRRKLKQVAEHAQRYRRDLLFLVQQNQLRKQQAEDLRARLLAVLERQQGSQGGQDESFEIGADEESVPANFVRNLLKRLRDSQAILEEYDTLLQFRENQVQELLAAAQARPDAGSNGQAPDFLVGQLRKQLSQARHRVRLLTRELAQSTPGAASGQSEYQERVKQLEALVAQTASGTSIELLQEKERHIEGLAQQVGPLQEAVKRLQSSLEASQKRVQELEARPSGGGLPSEADEMLEEVAALQAELDRLHDENDQLRAHSDPDAMVQVTAQINLLNQQLEEERNRRQQVEEVAREVGLLKQENEALRSGAADSQRTEKLEAAVVELRAKLQLAASKYQEVKQALLDKHRELNELKAKTAENEKKSEFLAPVVQTLEAALNEARTEAEKSKAELAAERQKVAALQKGQVAPAVAGAPAASGEALAAMEAKLKEARRSAVRAQAEAGVKRKEAAKLQEEVAALKEKLKAHGIAL